MNKELAKTLTTALVQFIDREQPTDKMCVSSIEAEELERVFTEEKFDKVEYWYAHRMGPEPTEFEKRVRFIMDEVSAGRYSADNIDDVRGIAKGLLVLAKKELLKDDELGKKHLEGYIMGREDTMREMKDFIESHFTHREYKSPECGTCASAWNTSSGTSTATLHGNTSATDGKEHNPSFTD